MLLQFVAGRHAGLVVLACITDRAILISPPIQSDAGGPAKVKDRLKTGRAHSLFLRWYREGILDDAPHPTHGHGEGK
jgi:hypothetical protein